MDEGRANLQYRLQHSDVQRSVGTEQSTVQGGACVMTCHMMIIVHILLLRVCRINVLNLLYLLSEIILGNESSITDT